MSASLVVSVSLVVPVTSVVTVILVMSVTLVVSVTFAVSVTFFSCATWMGGVASGRALMSLCSKQTLASVQQTEQSAFDELALA